MGYWIIRVEEIVQEITKFRCRYGSFCFVVMLPEIKNGTGFFQKVATILLETYLLCSWLVYIDDIFINSKTWGEHLVHVRVLLDRLRGVSLELRLKKFTFS